MNLSDFLADLLRQGVKFWAEGDRLRYRAPKGVLTSSVIKTLAANKIEILALITKSADVKDASSFPQIEPDPDQRYQPFPLTDIQFANWVGRGAVFEMGNVGNHEYIEIDVTDLDLQRCDETLRRLIERHEMLRAIILPDGRQQILEQVPPFQIKVVDLRGQDSQAVHACLEHIRDAMDHQMIPVEQWPAFDICVTLLDHQRSRLHLSIESLFVDAWSWHILAQEFTQLYFDPEAILPPLELSFRDYVLATEAALTHSDLYRRSQEYWLKRLPDLPPPPDVPLAQSPSSLAQPRFVPRKGRLSKEDWTFLKARAARSGLTPSGVLLAAFAEVLSAWSKTLRFSINMSIYNRLPLHEKIDNIAGDFTSLIVVAIDHSAPDTFEKRARRIQEQVLNDLEHSYYSGISVLRDLAKFQGGNVKAALPVVFTSTLIQNATDFSLFRGPWQDMDIPYCVMQIPQVWLDHQVFETEGALVFHWSAVEVLFPEGFLNTMFEAYCQLLQRLVSREESWQELSRLLLPQAQLKQRADVNMTGAPVSQDLLHTLFLKQASQQPHHIAVIAPTRVLTYQQVETGSARLAHWLHERGACSNHLVAVVMEKGWEQVIAVLGVLRSGAAYVPISPELPEERLTYLLENAEVKLVLTQAWVDEKISWGRQYQRIHVDRLDLDDPDVPALESPQSPQDLAYVIYTSGSTGQPKGVMIDHQGAVNTILDINQRFHVNSDDRVFALSALNFDLSVYDIFGTLAAGGTIVLPPEGTMRDPAVWLNLLVKEQVTIWNSVPALFQMLVDYTDVFPDALKQACLRLALLSGDWIPLSLPEQIKKYIPGIEVISLGGATEASIWSILYPITAIDPSWKSIPYGRPMRNQRFYVLNEVMEPCPVWVPGQLYIGGIGLAQGYWRDEEKTQASFLFHPQIKDRLYRTGDMGRYLPDGTIEFLGREDFQVKIHGHRIELGEIEETLLWHPEVQSAIVITRSTSSRQEKCLVAYVVLQPKQEADVHMSGEETVTRFFHFLQEKLPGYMVPSNIVVLDVLPLTPNGKVDRQALSGPAYTPTEAETAIVAPRDMTERQLADIFETILNVHPVGVRENFFSLRGNSLLALRLMAQIRKQFGQDLPLSILLQAGTIEDIALILRRTDSLSDTRNLSIPSQNFQQKDEYTPDTDPMARLLTIIPDPDKRYEPYPLTDLQQAYWIGQTDLFELGNLVAHGYIEFEFQQLDLYRLNRAIQCLIERHDVLRSIVLPDGRQQVLAVTPPHQIAVTDFRRYSEQVVTPLLEAIRASMRQYGPGTHEWPLWEIRASLLNHHKIRLHLSACFLLVDARSTITLINEVVQFYQDPHASLPPLELTCRDYILALQNLEQTDLYQQSSAYWRQRLATLPAAPELPLAKHPRDLKEVHFVSHSRRLDALTWQRLKALASRLELTPNAILYTAYAEILAAWSKTAHFTINMLFFNRFPIHPQVDDLVGNLSATILLEVNNTESGSFLTRAKRLQRQLWDDLTQSALNGVRVIREMAKTQGVISQALMPVTFASTLNVGLERDEVLSSMESGEHWHLEYHCIQTPQVYLDYQVYEDRDGLLLKWDMVEELFPEGVPAEMFAAHYQLLQSLADDETRWYQPYRQLVPAQQLALHTAVNATDVPLLTDLLHTLVIKQVRQRSSHKAIITTQRTLTYAQMHQMASKVGSWLRLTGARPNTLVAVVMEKGWEQVIAALGVLYAGAAYLPIDPALPQERLCYLLQDGEVQYALTQLWIDEKLAWPEHIQRLCIDEKHLMELPIQELDIVQQPHDLAYVIYTSGSTGLPKGVMIKHQGAVNTIVDINRRFNIGPDDRVLALSSLSFDLSVYDIFGVLAAGGTVVIPDAGASRDPAHWLHLLIQEKVSLWNSVPALMEMLIEYIVNRDEFMPRSLRLIMLSGDWIPVKLPGKIKAMHNDVQLISLGGATEASIWSIFYPIETIDESWKSVPYGLPLANQHVYVLDGDLNHRPTWVPGRLYIGGAGLAEGYWHDEAKTNTSFIKHPRTGERLYCTGDLGRYLPDGTIEFLGREDFQVKIQGYRIELGEIEHAFLQHPAVREVVAAVENSGQGEKNLIACVVPQKGQALDTHGLRAFIRKKLPAYMVPSAILVIETLPVTTNGKVDRKALSQLSKPASIQQSNFVAPRDVLEWQLVELWEDILEKHPIGVTDNFFELGGNSLLALRLMGRIRQQFTQDLPLSHLFERATIAQLASILRQPSLRLQYQQSSLVAIQPKGTKPPFFCVHPVGGNVLCYAELSRQLGTDQPFYALQAAGFDGEDEPSTSLSELAESYRAAIQIIQPTGPYLLGGWSMGGTVAFEMAQQWRKEGCEVALVALIDSDVPVSTEYATPLDDADLLAWFAKDLGGSSGKSLMIASEDLRELAPEQRISAVLERARAAQVLSSEADIVDLRRLVRVFQANALALSSYVPQAYPYHTILLTADETLMGNASDQTLGWGKLVGDALKVFSVPGNHYTIITQPYVKYLADRLKWCLEEAQNGCSWGR